MPVTSESASEVRRIWPPPSPSAPSIVSTPASSAASPSLTYFSSHQISLRMPSQKWMPLVAVPWPLTLSHHAIGLTGLARSEEHTSELQSLAYIVCRLLLEKKKRRRSVPYA